MNPKTFFITIFAALILLCVIRIPLLIDTRARAEAVAGMSVLRQLQQSIQTYHINYLESDDRAKFLAKYPTTLEDLVDSGLYPSEIFELQTARFHISYIMPDDATRGEDVILEIVTDSYWITMSRSGEGRLNKIQS